MKKLLILAVIFMGAPMSAQAHNPDYHARLADLFLDRVVPKHEWYQTRFISFLGVPEREREDRIRTMKFWLNNLHFSQSLEFFKEVPRSDGQLYWFYLEDFGWNVDAWNAVTRREPYFIEPAIFPDVANSLRSKMGLHQDVKTFQIEAIVRADWLFRDSVESDRSNTYFDLLFAKERYGGGRELVDKRIYHPGGDYRWYDGSVSKNAERGWYNVQVYENRSRGFNNFPKNEKDWLKLFGVDVIDKYLREQKINARHGAIVEEGASVVARGNRLLESIRTPVGSFWRTFDVDETKGNKDFTETLIYDFDFVAGELISNLPNGGQAYLLTLKDGSIVNVADTKVAIDRTDARDVRVRTPGSCVICHQSGIITPTNVAEDLIKDGITIKFKNSKKDREVRGFFLGWEEDLKSDQRRYERFIERTSGFEPGVNAAKFKEFRDFYDAPVTAEQAARECGVPVDIFKLAVSISPRARLLQLVQGRAIPRSTWEGGAYRESMLLLSALRKDGPKVLEVEFK